MELYDSGNEQATLDMAWSGGKDIVRIQFNRNYDNLILRHINGHIRLYT